MPPPISKTRPAAVAGYFYPADADELRRSVNALLAAAPPFSGAAPKAVIVPHAGYVFSGPLAAAAYARLMPDRDRIRRVVLVGPSHRVAFRGMAAPSATDFATPLGRLEVDQAAIDSLQDLPFVRRNDAAHAAEHSLEVQLPFLQLVSPFARIVPLAVGDARIEEIAEVLDRLWNGDETRIVVSSDLSHYLPYAAAREADLATARAIENADVSGLSGAGACGWLPVAGLLTAARARRSAILRLDLRNSGDTAGTRDRVVGYGAWALSA